MIISNHYFPLIKALYLQGGLVFYFKLYDDMRLKNLKHSQKINIVNDAVKLYRKDCPINLSKVLLTILIVCLIPAILSYFFVGANLAIGWFSISILGLNIKTARDETSLVEPYLDQVIK